MGFASRKGSFREGSLDQYLKEISQYPLIDKAEEARLAKSIKLGEEEALDKLVRSNLRFVVSVAKKYQNQGVPLSDLINEGNLGLIRAAHKFDETKGIKFISYAVWWIRQAILQALAEQSRIVRVPLNRAGALHRIGRRSSALLQELGGEPTVEEIADDLDISQQEVERTLGDLTIASFSGRSDHARRRPPAARLPARPIRARPRGRGVRPRSQEQCGGCALFAEGTGGQDSSAVLRLGRSGADDPRGDRGAHGHHPGAGSADQTKGLDSSPARFAGSFSGDLFLKGLFSRLLEPRPIPITVDSPGRARPGSLGSKNP